MPKFESKSGKSADGSLKLFGRMISVKSSSELCTDVNDNSAKANAETAALKRPTKVMPCPRCESLDTKFCYFNNYNVNQPRHYCRKCQRYWTAGGSLRNVPVGAGRRKNKPSFRINQGHSIQVSQNVCTDRQACIPLRLSRNSDGLLKEEPNYSQLRNFDEALNGTEAVLAQGKLKPHTQIDGYSHILNFQSKKSVEGCNCKHVGVGLCSIELPEKCTHLGKGVGSDNIVKPMCLSSDKTQLSATKEESSSEVVQTMDDLESNSSLNAMVSAAPISMSQKDFASTSLSSSMTVIRNFWPGHHNGFLESMPSRGSIKGGVQHKTNGVPWCPPSTSRFPAINLPVPCASVWGQQWSVPWKPANAHSGHRTLDKHERDGSVT